ncbi:hypothetical protein SEA_MARCIE_101 [Microbacterium phage Marcie]|nr:hypothetical protein SEA_MARCIE_101 [Microbacterium phage Marcie]
MNTHMPAELYNRLTAHLLQDGSRDGLFLANEVKDLYGASAQRKYADPIIPADEEYPERPQHLDFARMSAAAGVVDSFDEDSGLTPPEEIGVDGDSFKYMAINRVGTGLGALGQLALIVDPITTMAAAWGDGFAIGIEYHRRGGSRPAETGTTAGEGSAE